MTYPTDILCHSLRLYEHRYRDLCRRQTAALRSGEGVGLLRSQLLYTAAEIVELRNRISGGEPNLCY